MLAGSPVPDPSTSSPSRSDGIRTRTFGTASAVEAMMGVSGLDGNTAYPDGHPSPLPPLPIGRVGRRAAHGMNQLGWHWWPGSNAIASRRWGVLNTCVRRGVCGTGCPDGAKSTVDLTVWPAAMGRGAVVRTRARAARIEMDSSGRAAGVVYIDQSGREQLQRASVVVLCCNAIGTARLLLLSNTAQWPDGLANRSGLVGTRLLARRLAA